MMPNYGMAPGISGGMMPYGMNPAMMGGMGMMGMGGGSEDLESLSVVSLAARLGDPDFFQFLIEKGAKTNRLEEDGSSPLRYAVEKPNTFILKHLLENGLKPSEREEVEIATSFVRKGTLEQAQLLEQAGIKFQHPEVIEASIMNGNIGLVNFMIENAEKPLSNNNHWNSAFDYLEQFIFDYSARDLKLRPGIEDEELEISRKLATLFLENGLKSEKIRNSDDVAKLTREGAESLLRGPNEYIDVGVDSDGDGFDDYDEKITGHDHEDPNDTPTESEVDEAVAELDWRRNSMSETHQR